MKVDINEMIQSKHICFDNIVKRIEDKRDTRFVSFRDKTCYTACLEIINEEIEKDRQSDIETYGEECLLSKEELIEIYGENV